MKCFVNTGGGGRVGWARSYNFMKEKQEASLSSSSSSGADRLLGPQYSVDLHAPPSVRVSAVVLVFSSSSRSFGPDNLWPPRVLLGVLYVDAIPVSWLSRHSAQPSPPNTYRTTPTQPTLQLSVQATQRNERQEEQEQCRKRMRSLPHTAPGNRISSERGESVLRK
eukprot:763647-Hanusia_phi.AAC.5